MTPFFDLLRYARGLFLVLSLSACTFTHTHDAYLPSRNGIVQGERITVQGNENIYTVARTHNVSMRELIVLNDLKPPFEIRPGQTLFLPAGGSDFGGDMKAPEPAPLEPVEKKDVAPIVPAGVSEAPLAPVVPPPQAPPQKQEGVLTPPSVLAPVQAAVHPKEVPTTVAPVSAAPAPPPSAAPEEVADVSVSMVWPVQGPVLSSYGTKAAGIANEGIDIGAPKGSPVIAAAPGTVVYAGNDMKGFGNLVLVRHQGDWVTAYAHLDRVMVKKDSILAKGDMVGTVGKTGDAPTPRLHFEIRHAEKPVDPATLMKKL